MKLEGLIIFNRKNERKVGKKMKSTIVALIDLIIFFMFIAIGCSGGTNNDNNNPFDSGSETNRVMPLGRGVNMGNMLEAPIEGEWGETVQAEYFTLIKNKGFNTVRIPIRWSNHALTASPYTIDLAFFTRVDQVVGWALAQNLNVIINIHHYQDIMDDPTGQKPRFIELWKQIATRFKDYSPTLYFELLNEPNGGSMTASVWNGIIAETVTAIRAIDTTPNHTIIIGGINWNNAYSLNDLQIPEVTKVMATFHFYSPFSFTHQGAEWANPIPPTGVKWPGDDVQGACQAIRDELDVVKDWSQAHGNIPVLLGEFGAYSKGDIQSRANWTAYVRKQAETRGFYWTYWEFCAGFGVYDNDNRQWNRPLAAALGLNP
jgi:endoglucanase